MLGYLKISRIHMMMKIKNKRTFCFKKGSETFPFSVESFDNLRLIYPFYTDKSLLIRKIQNSFTLITYPSRWGKSQNLMMIKEFYSPVLDYNNKILDKKKSPQFVLFGGGVNTSHTLSHSKMKLSRLNIVDYEDVMADYGKHPVIHLTFGPDNDPKKMLKRAISQAYSEHQYLLKSEKLLSIYKKRILKCLNVNTMGDNIISLIQELNHYLYEEFGSKVVILIDEYDKPFNSFFYNRTDGLEKTIELLNAFYCETFKGASLVKSALITGIMNIPINLTPALNSFRVFNFPDTGVISPYYGFSEDEVKEILKISLYLNPDQEKDEKKINEIINGMRVYYTGNTINNISYYNPWSINNFVRRCRVTGYNDLNFKRYWIASNALRVVENCFKYPKLTEMIADVATGKSYYSKTRELDRESFEILQNITNGTQQKVNTYELMIFTNFLVCTGYLIKDGDCVKCPNKKIREILLEQLSIYLKKHRVNSRVTLLVPDNDENILEENLKTLKKNITTFYKQSLKLLVEKINNDTNEKQIRGNESVMVALFQGLISGSNENTTTNSKFLGTTDQWRPDLFLFTANRNIVFEFKHRNEYNKNDNLLEDGYKQFEGYAKMFEDLSIDLLGIVIVTNNKNKVEGLKAYRRGSDGLIK
jgi:hypothetical protein